MIMDGGQFRSVPRPTDREPVGRSEPPRRQPEEPQPVREEPKATYRPAPERQVPKEKKSFKRFKLPIILITIIIVGIGGWFAWSKTQTVATAIDTSKYQAVFFTNGQVYFGKLQAFNSDSMKLTDIYYLQSQAAAQADSKNPQQTSNDSSKVQLVKLGSEIHSPEDMMILSKDQVLFYENLKPDGTVAQSIEKNKKP